jgi:hypothetical protein
MRPTVFQVGGTLYWVIQTRNPDTMVLKDADSTPTVAVRKNGVSVGDSVTVTKRSATTGIYDCSYNPASEVEGDAFTFEESATVTGTTTSSATYTQAWNARVIRTGVVELDSDVGAQITGIKAKTDNLPSDPADQSLIIEATNAVMARLGAPAGASMSADISSIKTDTGTTLPAQISGISGGSGSGARTVTITVNDGTTVLQNALIRLTEGANTFTATTNVSGVATFNVDDATYTVAITKSGYSYAGTTLVVDGTETRTYSMTQVSVTPPTDPALSAIEVLCLGTAFTAQSGIDIDFRMSGIASGDQDKAYPGAKVTVTSNGSGIARWEAPRGATIEYKRGTTQVWTRATLDGDSLTSVTSVIGSP